MIRVVMADDHPIVREGLKHVVAQNPDIAVVGEADDAESTLRVCLETRPDVVLVDVGMPGPGILELIQSLKSAQPALRVLVLSVHPEEQYARRVLKAGADGYLSKNTASGALAGAIRQVQGGRKYVSPTLAEALAGELAGNRDTVPHERLSNREYEVLRQLGAGKKVDAIAEQMGLSAKTVRTYRARILEKLNLNGTAELIFYAIQHGLVATASEKAAEPPAPGRNTTARAKPLRHTTRRPR